MQREAFGFLNEWGMDGTYLQSLTLKPSLGCHMACDTQAECAMVTLIDQKTQNSKWQNCVPFVSNISTFKSFTGKCY